MASRMKIGLRVLLGYFLIVALAALLVGGYSSSRSSQACARRWKAR